jgi:hypothetical protein
VVTAAQPREVDSALSRARRAYDGSSLPLASSSIYCLDRVLWCCGVSVGLDKRAMYGWRSLSRKGQAVFLSNEVGGRQVGDGRLLWCRFGLLGARRWGTQQAEPGLTRTEPGVGFGRRRCSHQHLSGRQGRWRVVESIQCPAVLHSTASHWMGALVPSLDPSRQSHSVPSLR